MNFQTNSQLYIIFAELAYPLNDYLFNYISNKTFFHKHLYQYTGECLGSTAAEKSTQNLSVWVRIQAQFYKTMFRFTLHITQHFVTLEIQA